METRKTSAEDFRHLRAENLLHQTLLGMAFYAKCMNKIRADELAFSDVWAKPKATSSVSLNDNKLLLSKQNPVKDPWLRF